MTRVSGRMAKAGLLVLVLAGGCGSDASKKVPGGEATTIKIGTLHPLTGTSAANGNNRDQAVDLAVTEINAAGGVLGRHLEVLHRDQGTAADKAVMAAMSLVQEGVVAIVGPSSSASSLAVLNGVTRPLNMPQLSCCSTSPALGGMDNFFRTVPSDVLQSKVLARKAQQAGFSKVAIIYVEGAYGQGLAEGFMASFGASGASIMYKEEQPSYAAVVDAAIVGSPDAILLIAYPSDGGKILQESLAKRVQVRWMFSDSLHSQSFIDNLSAAKPLVEGAIGTAPAPSNDAADQARRATFAAAYKAAFSIDPTSFTDTAYDATYLLAAAIQKAGVTTPAEVTAQIRGVSGGAPGAIQVGPNEWAKALSTLKMGGQVDYQGASGPVDLDENGEPPTGYYIEWTVTSARLVDSRDAERP